MAKKEAVAAPSAGKAAKPKKRGKLGFFTTMIMLGIAAPFFFPTVVLIAIGMIPTLVAFFVDRDPERSQTAAIGAMNCAGVVPFVIDLWSRGQTMDNTFRILAEPATWLVMLGAAAIGQLIIFALPPAMAMLTLARAELRLKVLRHNLEQLKASWGPDVATTKPVEKVGRKD